MLIPLEKTTSSKINNITENTVQLFLGLFNISYFIRKLSFYKIHWQTKYREWLALNANKIQ
jgi:hypothetical protein